MLDELHNIDWSMLTHCYGPASDIPDLLMTLASGKENCDDTIETLSSRICHQGTLYEATAFVIPFLVKILEEQRSNADLQDCVLCLLKCISQGDVYLTGENAFKRNLWTRLGRDFDADLEIQQYWAENIRVEMIRSITAYLDHLDELTPTALILSLLVIDINPNKAPLKAQEIIREAARRPDIVAATENFFTCADGHMSVLIQSALNKLPV